VNSTNLRGTITTPAGYQLTSIKLFLSVGSSNIQLVSDNTPASSTTFGYTTPDIPGATATVDAMAVKSGLSSEVILRNVALNSQGLVLDFSEAPDYISPADAATGIRDTTTLSWTAVPGSMYVLIATTTGYPYLSYSVVTSATQAKIPYMPLYGLGLPSGAKIRWTVFAIGGRASTDDVAGSAGLRGSFSGTPSAELRLSYNGNGGTARTFTTAP
jgi:hypothetical protein